MIWKHFDEFLNGLSEGIREFRKESEQTLRALRDYPEINLPTFKVLCWLAVIAAVLAFVTALGEVFSR